MPGFTGTRCDRNYNESKIGLKRIANFIFHYTVKIFCIRKAASEIRSGF